MSTLIEITYLNTNLDLEVTTFKADPKTDNPREMEIHEVYVANTDWNIARIISYEDLINIEEEAWKKLENDKIESEAL